MKEEIDAAVAVLVGLPLSTAGRAVDMVTFGIGPVRDEEFRGKMRSVAQYALHIQCSWRLLRDGQILVGYADWRFPPGGVSADGFVASDAHVTRRDELVEVFMAHGPAAHVIEHVQGAPAGDLHVVFADGCLLEVLPDSATNDLEDDGDEYWRLFTHGNIERHFVVTAHGIST